MKLNKIYYCFNIKNIHQAKQTILICKSNKIIPIFFIKFYLINGFGPDYIIEFQNLLLKKYNKNNFKILVDCKKNYGLFIYLAKQKIDFLRVKGDKLTLHKLGQIAKKNKISINPKIGIIDLTKVKNIKNKIEKNIISKK